LAVTGCEDSVVNAPSLNCPLIRRNSSARFCEVSLMPLLSARLAWLSLVVRKLHRGGNPQARENTRYHFRSIVRPGEFDYMLPH